jgi:carbonic anhydrase
MSLPRRALLRQALGLGGAALAAGGLGAAPAVAAGAADRTLRQALTACRPAGDPLEGLLAGNRRFAAAWAASRGADRTATDRSQAMAALWSGTCQLDPGALAQGQRPWAAVLACADARVAPEWVFDVGPGELFEVRSAGNTAFDAGIASFEYAVAELAVPLIVVMGHQGCGAVTAARSDKPLTPLLEELVAPIRASLVSGDDLNQAIAGNARDAAQHLTTRSAVLREAVADGRLRVSALMLSLETGLVSVV